VILQFEVPEQLEHGYALCTFQVFFTACEFTQTVQGILVHTWNVSTFFWTLCIVGKILLEVFV
jgi:hypothetical protein